MADNRTKEIFEALMARDAVLLNEILENINRSERASELCADQYGSGEFPVGKPALVTAVQNGDLASVKVLMPYSVDIEAQEGLLLSAANGYTDILMFFIENGADINACTADHNCTPLMLAIENGHTNTVNVLIRSSVRSQCGSYR